jgi:hypothetical protein
MMDDVWVADVDDGAHSTYFPNAMSPTPIARTLDRQGEERKVKRLLCDVYKEMNEGTCEQTKRPWEEDYDNH